MLKGVNKFYKILNIIKSKGYRFLAEGGLEDYFINDEKGIIISLNVINASIGIYRLDETKRWFKKEN